MSDNPSDAGGAQPPVLMYSKTTCPYCHRAERILLERGVQGLQIIQIDREPLRRSEMITRAGGRTTVPQVFIGDRHIGGCDDLQALDARGGLVPLLCGSSV